MNSEANRHHPTKHDTPAHSLGCRIASFERSAITGISLLLAASFALQSVVIVHGHVVGKSNGEAKASLSPAALKLKSAAIAAANVADNTGPVVSEHLAPGLARLATVAKRLVAEKATIGTAAASVDASVDTGPASAARTTDGADETADDGAAAAPRFALRDDTFGPEMGRKPRLRLASIASVSSLTDAVPRPQRPDVEQAVLLVRPGDRNLSQRPRLLQPSVNVQRGGVRVSPPVDKVHFQPHTPERCLPHDLLDVVYDVAEKFGEVQILSTFRDQDRNRRVGGAERSFHLSCQAIDFRVSGRQPGLLAFLESRPEVGGLKRYPMGYFHIDNGPRRSW